MRLRSESGAAQPLLLLAIGGGAGLVLGAVLGLTGALSLAADPAPIAADATASYSHCPDEDALGVLHRGDRVFATGRDATGEWVQVRSPRSSDSRVWMRADHLTPDADLGDLPVIPCAVPVVAVVETTIPGETTTTEPATTTTTTTVPVATTTEPSTTTTTVPGTTTTVPATTTTAPATTTTAPPPSVGTVTSQRSQIWEGYTTYGPPYTDYCGAAPPDEPTKTAISAPISAPAGVSWVRIYWSVGGISGSVDMTPAQGQYYQATLGPFDADDPNVVPYLSSLPITVTVRVRDLLGRTAERSTSVTLNDCTFE
ncbi:MAG: hypothetical protein QY307_04290 [Acidimicrobiia bacterium]|nr:MAG: hypothetical protein QY307_04290 [Acidimicrobiia bacterium]